MRRRADPPALLAVFAHPDDESLACGGLLALSAAAGARTSLLCLTRGEHGHAARTDSGDSPERLDEARTRELGEAARVLGVAEVLLLDHEDGMLPWIDPARLERDVLDAIRKLEPDVLVTFDEDGLYWHPDHVAVHERVTATVAGLGSDAPALYYASIPAGAIRSVIEAAGAGRTILGVDEPDAFGAHAPPPTLVVDAGELAARKIAALRCHRSQVAGGPLDLLDPAVAGRLLATEHYRRAPVGRRGPTFVDALGAPPGSGPRGGVAVARATSVGEG